MEAFSNHAPVTTFASLPKSLVSAGRSVAGQRAWADGHPVAMPVPLGAAAALGGGEGRDEQRQRAAKRG